MVANHQYGVIVGRVEQYNLEQRSAAQTDRSLTVSAYSFDVLHIVGILRVVKLLPAIEVGLIGVSDIQLTITDNRTQHIVMLYKRFYSFLQSLCLHTLCGLDEHGLIEMLWLGQTQVEEETCNRCLWYFA